MSHINHTVLKNLTSCWAFRTVMKSLTPYWAFRTVMESLAPSRRSGFLKLHFILGMNNTLIKLTGKLDKTEPHTRQVVVSGQVSVPQQIRKKKGGKDRSTSRDTVIEITISIFTPLDVIITKTKISCKIE